MTIHLYYGDAHALPNKNNDRATWLAKLILDVKPDVVINGGDNADMLSLCSYDKGLASAVGRSYQEDIEAHLDFEDKLWGKVKKSKRKMARRVFLVGNHEQRIERAINANATLSGTIGYGDLKLKDNYDDIVYYSGTTPGSICIDGITYSHFFVTGVSGRPNTSSSPGSSTLQKTFRSVTQGHAHVLDYCTKPTIGGGRIHSLVGGAFMSEPLVWAGQANDIWWRGCFIKRNVENGNYDLEMVSMDRLKKTYE